MKIQKTKIFVIDDHYYEISAAHLGSKGVNLVVNGEDTGILKVNDDFQLPGEGALLVSRIYRDNLENHDYHVDFGLYK